MLNSAPNQECGHIAFYGKKVFLLLLLLLLSQTRWSHCRFLSSWKGAALASLLTLAVLRVHRACFSSANRSLRSICWGLLDFPVCVAERESVVGCSCRSGHSGGQCRELPSWLGLRRIDRVPRDVLLGPERFLWAPIFLHYLLYQRYGVSSSSRGPQYPAQLNECY